MKLNVADGGPGIPSDVVGRIFEPFYTAEGTRGAGLGLAIARELAERLSGSLEVELERGGHGVHADLGRRADGAAAE